MGKKSEDKRKNEARARVSSKVDDSLPIEELDSQSVDSELVEKLKGININSVNQLVVIGEDFRQQFSQADKQQILQGLQELMNCYKVKADVFVEQATTKFKDLGDHGTPFQKKQFEALSRTIVTMAVTQMSWVNSGMPSTTSLYMSIINVIQGC
ncbi:unnamed protein product [Arabis nemorensis]|uniref:Uncharacterized protein n=1 Tax=Arabis nemorensis TaxID=586526 RepID=A0A565CE67_9BRAS|nr:unnamed protein product [Arabis nemorensis]